MYTILEVKRGRNSWKLYNFHLCKVLAFIIGLDFPSYFIALRSTHVSSNFSSACYSTVYWLISPGCSVWFLGFFFLKLIISKDPPITW